MENSYQKLVQYLIDHKITIATAESCTGGLIAKLITDIPGSSEVFIGGVVSYSNEMKMKWLGVKKKTLIDFGAVSENTIAEMLLGIYQETTAAICVAVSGVAGPGGGSEEKPVGTVYLGVKYREKQIIRKFIFDGSREDVREKSANTVVEIIFGILK